MLRVPRIEDCVRLAIDLPEMHLQRGDQGVVRSTWFSPATAYEVEFHPAGMGGEIRVLVVADQLELEEMRLLLQS
ncbi:MAG: DUF4926 domain-containing protein [Tepidisphaerales bacterium]